MVLSARSVWRVAAIAGWCALQTLSSAGCAGPQSQINANPGATLTIGVDLPLSGADASDGVPTANAVKLAIRDANDMQLVAGFRLVADIRDDAVNGVHDPDKGAVNFQQFVENPDVVGVIGPLNSNVAQALIPISNADELVLISPANTNPDLTIGPQALALRKSHPLEITYYRVCPTDAVQGSAGATFAYETLKTRRAYIMDDDMTFGRGVADQWASQFRSEGGTILGHDHATPGQTDFTEMIDHAEAAGADVIFFGGESSTGAAAARKEMTGTGLASVPYLSGDGIQNQQFLDVAGPESENSYATVAAANAAELPTASEFIREYRAAYGQDAGAYSASAYVATMVLIDAIARAVRDGQGQPPTRAQVLAHVRSAATYSSILGVFSFDQNGDTTLKIVSIWRASHGKWVFLTQRDFGS
ncbi:MAG TPA: branched-chain amino acid ABC transporter substrate-binding protein [Candidatus Eremiobacteraceae bacterium]|nr:branched-chain amino acid ABC transporter substrate-binding protein [Candidatus Eremiobacteraceae bacterium]